MPRMASRNRTPSWIRRIYDKTAVQPLRALLDRRQSPPQAFQIVFDQKIFLVNVRRHRRARRYTLRIHSGTQEVILTMPPRGSVREAKAFAQKHGGWIAARLRRLPAAAPFADGAILPLRGIEHRVMQFRAGAARCGLIRARVVSICSALPAMGPTSNAGSLISCAARRIAICSRRAAAPRK